MSKNVLRSDVLRGVIQAVSRNQGLVGRVDDSHVEIAQIREDGSASAGEAKTILPEIANEEANIASSQSAKRKICDRTTVTDIHDGTDVANSKKTKKVLPNYFLSVKMKNTKVRIAAAFYVNQSQSYRTNVKISIATSKLTFVYVCRNFTGVTW